MGGVLGVNQHQFVGLIFPCKWEEGGFVAYQLAVLSDGSS